MIDLSIFNKFNFENPPICVKFHLTKPENVKQLQKQLTLCQMVKEAQSNPEPFYITKENENCMGKYVLGMVGRGEDIISESGQQGVAFEVFNEARANARLYKKISTIDKGLVNYVEFAQLGKQNFDPDLLMIMADVKQAEIILRAMSYRNCDLWESVSSPVIGCSWLYPYPFLSGKVNFVTTGMYHGMIRRQIYPEGWKMISIPYNKLPEIVDNLKEMPWKPIGYYRDDEHNQIMNERLQKARDMINDPALKDFK